MTVLAPGRNLVLIGLMGAGKSTVGRILAARLGRAFVDTDAVIEADAGRSVAELWAEKGESWFRARESEVIRHFSYLRGQVIAVGGGAVEDPDNVTHLRAEGDLVLLQAEPAELAGRLRGAGRDARPLLQDPADLTTRLEELQRLRAEAYGTNASHVVDTAGRDADEVADDVLGWAATKPGLLAPREAKPGVRRLRPPSAAQVDTPRVATRIPVAVPGVSYDVVVGDGLLDDLAAHLDLPPRTRRVALVTCGPVGAIYGERVEKALAGFGVDVHTIAIPDGEEAKTLATLESVYHRLAAIPLGRADTLVALGGGVVGDLAGFAAASWNRGVALVQVPTTLVAQVDAAVGGKTGVNLPEGKNLVGAFHQPLAVIADTATLATLPERERRGGLGEVVKYGFIADPALLELLESEPAGAVAGEPELLAEIVRRSVAIKARVVAADEREAGERALLNYGHTVGHAIEALTDYDTYRHGEAVALGMVAAARLGERLGVSEDGTAARTEALCRALGLPTGGVRLDPQRLWQVMARDKKAGGRGSDHGVRFVLCRRPGEALVVDPPDRAVVDEVLRSLAFTHGASS